MSIVRTKGKLIDVDSHATMDIFKNIATVKITIEISEGNRVVKNMPIAPCFKTVSPLSVTDELILPAIGDIIEIGWDYERFEGYIYEFAHNRNPIGDIPVTDEIPFNLKDILDSLK